MLPLKRQVLITISAILLFSLLFAFMDAYNNTSMSLPFRIFYWISIISTGVIAGFISLPVVINGRFAHSSIMIKILVLSALCSIPVPISIAAFSGGLVGDWPLLNWPIQYLLAFITSLIISTCMYMYLVVTGGLPSSLAAKNQKKTDQASLISQFMQRLPIKYHLAELYAVSSEDHYVKVHTSEGQELILMRLSDALKELSNVDGIQTHRSWWVARTGISESIKKNGKYSLLLKSNAEAPIARSYINIAKTENYI